MLDTHWSAEANDNTHAGVTDNSLSESRSRLAMLKYASLRQAEKIRAADVPSVALRTCNGVVMSFTVTTTIWKHTVT